MAFFPQRPPFLLQPRARWFLKVAFFLFSGHFFFFSQKSPSPRGGRHLTPRPGPFFSGDPGALGKLEREPVKFAKTRQDFSLETAINRRPPALSPENATFSREIGWFLLSLSKILLPPEGSAYSGAAPFTARDGDEEIQPRRKECDEFLCTTFFLLLPGTHNT